MRTALTAVLLLALIATGCNSDDTTGQTEAAATQADGTTPADGAGTDDQDPLVEVLVQAQEATLEAGSAAVELTQEIADQTVTGHGAFAFDGEPEGRMVMEQPQPDGSSGEIEMIMAGTMIWMRLPAEASPADTPWIAIDLTDPAVGGSPGLEPLTNDPVQSLAYLRNAEDVEEHGEEEIAGVTTTRYSYAVDLATAVEVTDDPTAAAFLEQTRQQLGQDRIPAEVWIDEEGLVRQQSSEVTVVGPDGTSVETTSTVTYTEFGVEIDVTPPPEDEVTDLADLQQGAGGPAAAPSPSPTD